MPACLCLLPSSLPFLKTHTPSTNKNREKDIKKEQKNTFKKKKEKKKSEHTGANMGQNRVRMQTLETSCSPQPSRLACLKTSLVAAVRGSGNSKVSPISMPRRRSFCMCCSGRCVGKPPSMMAAEGEARKNNVIIGGDKEKQFQRQKQRCKPNKVKDNDKGGRLKFNP